MVRPPRLKTRGPVEFRHRAFDYRPPRFLKLIRYGLISLISLAVLSILYSVYWFVAAQNLRDGTRQWFAARAAQGMEAGYDRVVLSGFPAAIRVEIAAPHVARKSGPAPWQWRSAAAAVQVRPWNLRRGRLEITGDTEVGFVAAGKPRRYGGEAGTVAAELAWFGDGRPRALDVAIDRLHLAALPQDQNAPPDNVAVRQLRLAGENLELDDQNDYHQTSFTLNGVAEGVEMPSFLHSPLGQTVAEAVLNARVMGPLRLDDVRAGLAAWRDGGGTVEIDGLEARHGPLHVRANGTLALDAELQPVGALTAKIAGFFEAVDAFQRANLIRSRNAAMAKVVLSALAKRPEDGGPATLSVPVTIQDGKVYAGPVPLATLPRIDWPETAEPRLRIFR